MFGSETLTMVVSSTSMKVGRITAAAISQGFTGARPSSGAALLPAGRVVIVPVLIMAFAVAAPEDGRAPYFTRTFGSTDMPGPRARAEPDTLESLKTIFTGTRCKTLM